MLLCITSKTRLTAPTAYARQGAEAADAAAGFMSQPFDWEHQWYPVAVASDLVPGRHALDIYQLLL